MVRTTKGKTPLCIFYVIKQSKSLLQRRTWSSDLRVYDGCTVKGLGNIPNRGRETLRIPYGITYTIEERTDQVNYTMVTLSLGYDTKLFTGQARRNFM